MEFYKFGDPVLDREILCHIREEYDEKEVVNYAIVGGKTRRITNKVTTIYDVFYATHLADRDDHQGQTAYMFMKRPGVKVEIIADEEIPFSLIETNLQKLMDQEPDIVPA